MGVGVFTAIFSAYFYWFKPQQTDIKSYRPQVCSEILDRNQKILDYACPFSGYRFWKPLVKIDEKLKDLVIMLEDAKFYQHDGFDIDAVVDAVETNLKSKKFSRGGSTITQQLVKNIFLNKEKTLTRKASEVPLTMRLENELSKRQILELYLNIIEWGPGIYGVEAASRLYFDHDAQNLRDEEAWLLALMIPNPKELCLWHAPRAKKSILKRARTLMNRLVADKQNSRDEAQSLYEKFEIFIELWMNARPKSGRENREYPVRSLIHKNNFEFFSFDSLGFLKQGALKSKNKTVVTTIDKQAQIKLEKITLESLHGTDKKTFDENYFALLENGEIRALFPSVSNADLIVKLSQDLGYELKVLSPLEIKKQSLIKQ